MSGLNKTYVVNHDEFHNVDHIPVHLPKIDNNCTNPDKCVLQAHTITENVYSELTKLDVAPFNSADEMRVKMTSR
jgi:hypothetical protein